jgi:hypothetical protein
VDAQAWERAAQTLGLPLAIVRFDDAETRALYGADIALVRPDHHIAWRGDATADPGSILAAAIGISNTAALQRFP